VAAGFGGGGVGLGWGWGKRRQEGQLVKVSKWEREKKGDVRWSERDRLARWCNRGSLDDG
jgi:hypothetical protein